MGRVPPPSGSLEQLDLATNKIGDAGAEAVAEAVRSSSSMTHLYMDTNNIGAATEQSLRDVARERKGFSLSV